MLLRNDVYFTKSQMSRVHGGRVLGSHEDARGREVDQRWVLWPLQHPFHPLILASKQIKAYPAQS